MTLIEQYEKAIQKGEIVDNPKQRAILHQMEKMVIQLIGQRKQWTWPWKRETLKGFYLYGPVGAGKTYLMDLFFQGVEIEKKTRVHFHYFMQQIDKMLRQFQGVKNPLQRIADNISKTTTLLCIDEFLVQDVAHAMILAELLKYFFSKGIVLVATSNIKPEDLYLNGIQRARFLKAISLIKEYCDVVSLEVEKDYRLGRPPSWKNYLFPLNRETEELLVEQFTTIDKIKETGGVIQIQNRDIPFVKRAEQSIWFDFSVICSLPRCQLDYLEIAKKYKVLFLSNIPILTVKDTIAVILLIHLIDVLYDEGIQLIISAAVPLDELYVQGEMVSTFTRTLSRLHEMQSFDYLVRHSSTSKLVS